MDKNEVTIGAQTGIAYRTFANTAGNKDDFVGLETVIFAEFNQIRPFLKLTYFKPSEEIDGLSGLCWR